MRTHDIQAIIHREVNKNGAVPPPHWVAKELGIDRAGVSRIFKAFERDGLLRQPHGVRGAWVLVGPGGAECSCEHALTCEACIC